MQTLTNEIVCGICLASDAKLDQLQVNTSSFFGRRERSSAAIYIYTDPLYIAVFVGSIYVRERVEQNYNIIAFAYKQQLIS